MQVRDLLSHAAVEVEREKRCREIQVAIVLDATDLLALAEEVDDDLILRQEVLYSSVEVNPQEERRLEEIGARQVRVESRFVSFY